MITTGSPGRAGGGPARGAASRAGAAALATGLLAATAWLVAPATSAHAAPGPAVAGPARHRVVGRGRQLPSAASAAVDGDLGTRWASESSATRSGSGSTWGRAPPTSTAWSWSGSRRTRPRTSSRSPRTAARGPPCTRPARATAVPTRSRSTGAAATCGCCPRPGRAGYGNSLWELRVFGDRPPAPPTRGPRRPGLRGPGPSERARARLRAEHGRGRGRQRRLGPAGRRPAVHRERLHLGPVVRRGRPLHATARGDGRQHDPHLGHRCGHQAAARLRRRPRHPRGHGVLAPARRRPRLGGCIDYRPTPRTSRPRPTS